MTREEASVNLEKLAVLYQEAAKQSRMVDYSVIIETLKFASSSLRSITREQVEKAWPGCNICRGEKKVKSDNFCGAATMRIASDSIDLYGDEKKIKFFGHIYAPSFSVKFCPFCGSPLTDEAVNMMVKKLEEMQND